MASDTHLQLTSLSASHQDQPPKPMEGIPGSAKSFVDLPAEMRNMIYHYLFPEGVQAVQLLARNGRKGYIAMSDRLGLLATCRQIYEETTGFLRSSGRTNIRKSKTLDEVIDATMSPTFYATNPILSLVLPANRIGLDFDLGNKTLRRYSSGLVNTSKCFREICMTNAYSVEVSASLTTRSIKSDFDDFHALRQWIDDGHGEYFRNTGDIDFDGLLILSYDLGFFAALRLLRLDFTAFMRATKSFCVSDCQVMVHVRYDEDEDGDEDWSHTTSVTELHERLLVFLWRLIGRYPELRDRKCPRVWFDGLLWPREAEFAGKAEDRFCIKTQDIGFSQERQENDCDKAWDAIMLRWALEPGYNSESLVGIAVDLAQRIGEEAYW